MTFGDPKCTVGRFDFVTNYAGRVGNLSPSSTGTSPPPQAHQAEPELAGEQEPAST